MRGCLMAMVFLVAALSLLWAYNSRGQAVSSYYEDGLYCRVFVDGTDACEVLP